MFWEKVNLKNESDVKWLLTWCAHAETNDLLKTIQQLTENNESDLLYFLSDRVDVDTR